MDDNQLIALAQQGNLQAENDVLLKYVPLVTTISRTYYVIGEDCDDLVQVGMIGLMRAVRTFNIEGGATFKTYASTCIHNSIKDVARKAKVHNVAADVDINDLNLFSDEHEPEKLYIEDETSRILLDTIYSALNEREITVLKLYLDAMSYNEISRKLGLERKQVDNTIYSLKKKIKSLLDMKK